MSVGTYGPFTSGDLPNTATHFLVDITKVIWPPDGAGEVMTLIVEESNDGGQSWQLRASDTWCGGLTYPKGGGPPMLTDWLTGDMRYPKQGGKIRLTLQVLQACTISGTVSVQ